MVHTPKLRVRYPSERYVPVYILSSTTGVLGLQYELFWIGLQFPELCGTTRIVSAVAFSATPMLMTTFVSDIAPNTETCSVTVIFHEFPVVSNSAV